MPILHSDTWAGRGVIYLWQGFLPCMMPSMDDGTNIWMDAWIGPVMKKTSQKMTMTSFRYRNSLWRSSSPSITLPTLSLPPNVHTHTHTRNPPWKMKKRENGWLQEEEDGELQNTFSWTGWMMGWMDGKSFTTTTSFTICIFLKKTLPGTLVNQCPCVFVRCINTIVQISKPYDLTVQLIINCGPKNYKIPSVKAHPVSCTS